MSGVVNKEVAERAHEVKADELIRKPFHPQDLVGRVKKLLDRSEPEPTPTQHDGGKPNPLTLLFERAANLSPQAPPAARPAPVAALAVPLAAPIAAPPAIAKQTPAGSSQELLKLRAEIRRLESLIKKLQS